MLQKEARATTAVHAPVFTVGAIVAGLLTLLFGLWVGLQLGGPRTTDAFDDIGELVAAWCATGACVVAAIRARGGRASWGLLGASSFAWGVGELIWCYYDLGRGIRVPFPSWADAGFLAAVPFAFAGLVVFPSSPRRMAYRVQGLLDGAIIATTLLFASWATVLGPLFRAHQGGVFKQTVSLAYPVGDVVMLSLAVILIARARGRGRVSLGLVLCGVAAFAIADSSFAYFTEVNSYGIGNILDTGWVAGYLLIALGALWATVYPTGVRHPSDDSSISILAPYVPVLVVLAVTAVELVRGRRIEQVTWTMALALAALVVGREGLRLWAQVRRVDFSACEDPRVEVQGQRAGNPDNSGAALTGRAP
jgi:hypothetical protein